MKKKHILCETFIVNHGHNISVASIITPSNFHVFKLQYLTLNLGVSILTLTPVPKRLFRSAAPVFLGEARALGVSGALRGG